MKDDKRLREEAIVWNVLEYFDKEDRDDAETIVDIVLETNDVTEKWFKKLKEERDNMQECIKMYYDIKNRPDFYSSYGQAFNKHFVFLYEKFVKDKENL